MCVCCNNTDLVEFKKANDEERAKFLHDLKVGTKLKQKPVEWSEKYIANIFEKVGVAKIVRSLADDELTNALQSAMIELAKTCQIVEWGEDDEKQIRQIERIVKDSGGTLKLQEKIHNWLNSLRPQKRWKPMEEQIQTLEYYMHTLTCNEHKEVLFGLMEQLKAL